ncbi:hypothetical protein [Lentilitoribacter sp. Alg239-R112]|nr:hypothetical protein [Lentilitoribacter sp. Alg239-R112]
MKFPSLLQQVRSAYAVGTAIENGKAPSKTHLKNLGIEKSYSEMFKR